jgi:hypothetical protein
MRLQLRPQGPPLLFGADGRCAPRRGSGRYLTSLPTALDVASDGRQRHPKQARDLHPRRSPVHRPQHPQPQVLRVAVHGGSVSSTQSFCKPLYEATQREKKPRCVPVVKPTLETLGATFCRFLAGYREHRGGWDPVSRPSRGLTRTSKLLFVHGATPLPAVVCPEPIVPKTLMMLAPPVTEPTAHGENQQAARQDASHYAVPPLSLRPAGRSSGSTINYNGVACHIRK